MSPISISEARKLGLVEHLIFTRSETLIDTQYGRVSARTWMELEAARIVKPRKLTNYGRKAAIVEDYKGLIALYVNNVGSN